MGSGTITLAELGGLALLLLGLAGAAAALTGLYVRWGRVVDVPNERSSHSRPVARGGGIIIALVFLIGVVPAHYLLEGVGPGPAGSALLLAASVVAVVGFIDDVRSLPVWLRLGVQVAAALYAALNGLALDLIGLPGGGQLELGWVGYPLAVFWMLALTNAYNFMDGLDGLMAGVGAITAMAFALYALACGAPFALAACLALASALLGFLPFNWPEARVFMGDAGSQFLGFLFAGMAMLAPEGGGEEDRLGVFVMLLLLFHVAFDTAATFIRRLAAGEPLTQAHRTHLYQLCQRLGRTHRHVSLTHHGMSVLQAIALIWLAIGPGGAERLFAFAPFVVVYSLYASLTWRRARRAGLIR